MASSILLSLLPALTLAQLYCGQVWHAETQSFTNVGTCGDTDQCCSQFGVCGKDPVHCGDFCQGAFSYDPQKSCYGDRFGRPCISGFYDFGPNTWVINSDAYTGDHNTADFVADSRGLSNGNIRFSASNRSVLLTLAPAPNDPTIQWSTSANSGHFPEALGARLTSTAYMTYGTFKARLLSSGIGGIVTAFISYSDDKDEIDWEITGKNNFGVQTNYFYRGVVDYTKSVLVTQEQDTSMHAYELGVVWTADSITWYVDGSSVRTVQKADTCDATGNCKFPSHPSRIQVAIWDGGAGTAGTRDWAGGYIPWDQTGKSGYNATFEYVSIQCEGDPEPTGPPARKKGYYAPSVKEPTIKVAIPGVAGYDSNAMANKGSVFSNTYGANPGQGGGGGGGKGSNGSGAMKAVTVLNYSRVILFVFLSLSLLLC